MAKKHYSLEYQKQIVALVQAGRTIGSVATELGLANQTVRNRLKEALDGPHGAA